MFELPEDLAGLSLAELDALLEAARAESTEILSDIDTADLDRVEALATAVEAILAAKADVETADAAKAARAAELAARIAPAAEVEDETEVEVELSDDSDDTEDEEVVEETLAVAPVTPAKAAVKAAPKMTIKKAAPKNSSIRAASNLPGVNSGKEFGGLGEISSHLIRAFESISGQRDGSQGVFSLEQNFDPRLVANGKNDQEVFEYATSQARLANGAGLLAAGGWCAPAEQKYDICDLAGLDGILNIPGISVPRGSIRYFRTLDYNTTAAAAAAGMASFTNAELVAEPPVVKPCVEIPCTSPVEFVTDVTTFCVRAGLLQQKAFPELITAWMRQALIAHQHYLNARHIAAIVALAAADSVTISAEGGTLASFLNAIDLQAADLRFDHGMTQDAVIEGFAPWWLPMVLRADAIRRPFDADFNVTKGQIDSWLAARNVRLDWVKDYIDAPFTGSADVVAWPTSTNVVLYPAGAYLLASDPVIRVGALQDSTLLQTNRTQLLFVESQDSVLPACGNGRVLTLDSLCPSGTVGGQSAGTALTCPTI